MNVAALKALICVILACLSLTGCDAAKTETIIKEKTEAGYMETKENSIIIEKVSENCYKGTDCANPLSANIFCADPTAVEYNDRLYVFGTNDHQQYEAVGDDGKNTYEKIKSLVIFSTDDMVNWTYHGLIDTETIAPWIINSWAPSVVSRVESDGLTHFYLYFSNNGCGVGVITATDPLGPWSDPLGKPLVESKTDGLKDCPNPFDPGVCIDEDGVGWLSFGGGKASDGTSYMPGVSRIVKLGADMVSFDSEFAEIPAPYFFEASELNFINGTYIYTYNNNWDARSKWEIEGAERPSACSMAYMTTKTPLDPESWEYRGDYFPNPGECGMDYSNNHSHYEKYMGKYYMFHHTMLRQASMTTRGGFRSLCVVELPFNEETLEITRTKATKEGVQQIKYVDPYVKNTANTEFTSADMEYEYSENKLVTGVKSGAEGAWLLVKAVNFGKNGASLFSAVLKGKGRVEVRLDALDSECAAALEFSLESYNGVLTRLEEKIMGAHDVYFVFSDPEIDFSEWQFS